MTEHPIGAECIARFRARSAVIAHSSRSGLGDEQIDASSATFENPAHDFPKVVRDTPETLISGADSRAQSFVLKRQE